MTQPERIMVVKVWISFLGLKNGLGSRTRQNKAVNKPPQLVD